MKKIVVVKKKGSDIQLYVDVSRIVAISDIVRDEEYYIYFENAVWCVQKESFNEVFKLWSTNTEQKSTGMTGTGTEVDEKKSKQSAI